MREQDRWQRVALGEIAQFLNGYPFKPADWSERGTPIVRIAQMTGTLSGCDRFRGQLSERFVINNGDLLFSWSATLMALIWTRGPAFLNQHIFKVVPRQGAELRFLHHLLDHHTDRLSDQSHGTTMRHITRADLLPYEVDLPPLDEQRRIAEILDTLDEAVHKTEQLIAKLKQMKQGLLHDLLTRGIDENGELRDPERHPELFKETSVGRIPRSWEPSTLESLTSRIVDGVHHTPTYTNSGVPFLTVENLTRGRGISLTPCRFVSARAHDEYKRRADPTGGDVLVSKDGTLGVARVVPRDAPEMSIFVSVALLRPRLERVLPEFVCTFFDTHSFSQQLGTQSAGTGLKHIHLEHFRKFVLAVPDLTEQRRIFEVLNAADKDLGCEHAHLDKLQRLKAGLSEDLLTGRVRVSALPDEVAA